MKMKVSSPQMKSSLTLSDEVAEVKFYEETQAIIPVITPEVSADTIPSANGVLSPSSKEFKHVAALHNLGNTCFINSVLQVLFRTPGFVELVANLAVQVQLVQQAAACLHGQSYEADVTPRWTLITHLNALFLQMRKIELRLSGEDVRFSALRPYGLLECIRLLNPMFGDSLQHDAHELLRCLMSYVDDATTHLATCRRDLLNASVAIRAAFSACAPKSRANFAAQKDEAFSFESRSQLGTSHSLTDTPFCNNCEHYTDCCNRASSECFIYRFFSMQDLRELSERSVRIVSTKAGNRRRNRSLKYCRSASFPEVKVSLHRLSLSDICACLSSNGLSKLSLMDYSKRSPRLSLSVCSMRKKLLSSQVWNGLTNSDSSPSNGSSSSNDDQTVPCLSENRTTTDNGSLSTPVVALFALEAFDRGLNCRVDLTSSQVFSDLDRCGLNCRVYSANNQPISGVCERPQRIWPEGPTTRCSKYSPGESGISRRFVELPAVCVGDIFGGTMAMRTRCLSCNGVTSRNEIFEDIALPINQSTPQGVSSYDWIFLALDEVEKLQGDNKYHCGLCGQLTDIERSVHYVTAPRILTLHLKRFASHSSNITKTVDNVTVPMVLPCIESGCRFSSGSPPAHWYELYGVVAHSGRLASAGHYIAYVRDCNAGQGSADSSSPLLSVVNNAAAVRGALRSRSNHRFPGCKGNSVSSSVDERLSIQLAAISTANRGQRRRWFECDDESVNVLSEAQFEAKLKNAGRLTPYLLFYEKRYLETIGNE